MPRTKNPPKQVAQGGKKRKDISPLLSDTTQVSDSCSKTSSVNTANVNIDSNCDTASQQCKRFHSSSPEHFIFNTFDNMSMNFSQQPYPGQVMQSPQGQFSQQFMTASPSMQTSQPPTPPPWATSLMEDVKSIKASVARIESVEKTVNAISVKLSDLEIKVGKIDTRVNDVENSCSFVSTKYDEQSTELKAAKNQIKNLQESCDGLNKTVSSLENDRDKLKDRVLDHEFRSMRENLMFYGIPETPVSDESEITEDCDTLVKDFINTHVKMNAATMLFDRAHRIGVTAGKTTPRPIIVKFHYYHEREMVRKAATATSDQMKLNKVGVGVQLPKEWRDARKELYPVLTAEKRKGHSVKFVGEKLFINGHPYKPQVP